MKITKKGKVLSISYIILSIIFIIPSIKYLIENKTVYKFEEWFKFFLDNSKIEIQTLSYIAILLAITIFYVMIIKNRNKIFKNIKIVLKYTAIVGSIYIFAIPFTCSDVFYYMGVGRLDSEYSQNPYYTTIKEYVEENQENAEVQKDTVLMQGYMNGWADSTVVYGPIWQLICKGMALLSFGNVDIGLLAFKMVMLIIHIINCWLIYKITGKKIFSIIYGLNPFILIEAIMCAHNDLFVILFTLCAFYFMKKKKLWISMVALALATGIKYFSILLLPFIIIYYFREEDVLSRISKCIKYSIIFGIALIIPYLLYIQDFSIFSGMATQQGKIAKSIYLLIYRYFPTISTDSISNVLLRIFIIGYFYICLIMILKKQLKWKYVIQKYTIALLTFLFVLITQFQPWYLMWVIPIFMWQKANNVKVLIAMGIISEFSNAVFVFCGEGYVYGVPFIFIMYTLILAFALIIEKKAIKRKTKCYLNNKQIQ